MAQVTLYIPDALEAELRKGAKRAKKSLSAYVADLASGKPAAKAWPREFLQTFGSWEGDLEAPTDLPPEPREDW